MPVENLLTPDLLRRFLWEGPAAPTTAEVAEALVDDGRPALADDDHRAAHLARLHRAPPA